MLFEFLIFLIANFPIEGSQTIVNPRKESFFGEFHQEKKVVNIDRGKVIIANHSLNDGVFLGNITDQVDMV